MSNWDAYWQALDRRAMELDRYPGEPLQDVEPEDDLSDWESARVYGGRYVD